MKTLYLLRHAKSSWGQKGLPDHERPLNERGRRAAAVMGRYLHRSGMHPDAVLASDATRVVETLAILLPELGRNPAITYDRGLYLASPDTLMRHLQRISGSPDKVLIIAHNPGIQEFALELAGTVEDDEAHDRRDRLKAKFPTAGLAILSFKKPKSWAEVRFGTGALMSFQTPRELDRKTP